MPRVLIVDDNEAYCEALRDALVADGFAVDIARSGTLALDHLGRQQPDAILLDLMIDDIDGETLAGEFARRGSIAPIIVLSANLSLAATAKRMQAAAYLSKPFSLPKLVELLQTVTSTTPGAPLPR